MKKIELYKTAHEAASKSHALASEMELDAAIADSFKAAGHDTLDYGEWKRLFFARRTEIVSLANTPTDSQLASDKAAATKEN